MPFRKLPLAVWVKGWEETGWRQEGQLDTIADFLVSSDMGELGRRRGKTKGGWERAMMWH